MFLFTNKKLQKCYAFVLKWNQRERFSIGHGTADVYFLGENSTSGDPVKFATSQTIVLFINMCIQFKQNTCNEKLSEFSCLKYGVYKTLVEKSTEKLVQCTSFFIKLFTSLVYKSIF